MNILLFMVPAAIIIAAIFVAAFIWATKNGQYDDLDTPAHKILLDDEKIMNDKNIKTKKEMS